MRQLHLLSILATVSGENGIRRVLDMLATMKSKSEADKQSEAVKFSSFKTWCGSTTTELAVNIERVREEISEGKNTIASHKSKAKEMSDKSANNAAEIKKITLERNERLEARAADKAVFIQVKTDYETSITAIEKAVAVLKSQPKVVSQGGAGALVQISASSMTKAQKDLISLLVTGAPQPHAYENHSGGVIHMLEDLKAKFIEELNSEQTTEITKEGETNKIVMGLSGSIENLEEEKKRFDGAFAKHTKLAANAQAELEEDGATLTADTDSKKEVTTTCKTKEAEFTERSSLRDQELVALQQAIDVINSISVKKTASGLVQKEEAVSFLQIRLDHRENVEHVVKFLTQEGKAQHSKKLQLLALKVAAGGPFDKVLQMIEDMIERLKAETLEETGKHGQCVVWMSENKSDLETSDERLADLKGSIEEQTGIVGTTSQKIKDLSQSEADSAQALKEATKVRASESETNTQTIADAKEGEDAVDKALQILNDFYSKAATATSLLQAEQVPVEAGDVPSTWDSSFQGSQQGGSDVINVLEVIQADFLKLRSETEAAEVAAKKAYDDFVNEQSVSKAGRLSNLAHQKKANSDAKAVLAAAKKDLVGQEEVHSGLIEQKRVIEQDKGCIASSNKTPDELFKERMEARDREIESLRNALSLLK